jgi:hypothetical protein
LPSRSAGSVVNALSLETAASCVTLFTAASP